MYLRFKKHVRWFCLFNWVYLYFCLALEEAEPDHYSKLQSPSEDIYSEALVSGDPKTRAERTRAGTSYNTNCWCFEAATSKGNMFQRALKPLTKNKGSSLVFHNTFCFKTAPWCFSHSIFDVEVKHTPTGSCINFNILLVIDQCVFVIVVIGYCTWKTAAYVIMTSVSLKPDSNSRKRKKQKERFESLKTTAEM